MSRLLDILTTRGSISFGDFNKSFDYLYGNLCKENEIGIRRAQIARFLQELGYCEFDYTGRKVYCNKPALALLPGRGAFSAVLTGARSGEMITRLARFQLDNRQEMDMYIQPCTCENIPMPDTVRISVLNPELLAKACGVIGAEYLCDIPVSWKLLHASAGVNEYESSLNIPVDSDINWVCRVFSVEHLCFKKNNPLEGGLIEFTNPVSQQKIYIWSREGRSLIADREWGRFLALKYSNASVLLYDRKHQLLGVPSYTPLPGLLARAAAFCSGAVARTLILPVCVAAVPEGMPVDVYPGVPEEIVALIAAKTGQGLRAYNFTVSEEGAIQ